MRIAAFVFLLVLVASYESNGATIKHLNNLVTELWAKKSLPTMAVQELTFSNPYDGWVFFSCSVRAAGNDAVRLCIDSQSKDSAILVANAKSDGPIEAMRHLAKGEHTATLFCEGKPSIDSVVIRAIPELIYCQYPAVPFVTQHGAYNWSYIQKHIAANANCITVAEYEKVLASDKGTLQAWKAQGKKWVFNSGIPGSGLAGGSEPLEDSYKVWYNHKGFQEPLADGIIVDEFIFGPKDKRYATWAAAIDKIYEDPKMKDKVFYAWTACEPNV